MCDYIQIFWCSINQMDLLHAWAQCGDHLFTGNTLRYSEDSRNKITFDNLSKEPVCGDPALFCGLHELSIQGMMQLHFTDTFMTLILLSCFVHNQWNQDVNHHWKMNNEKLHSGILVNQILLLPTEALIHLLITTELESCRVSVLNKWVPSCVV